MVATWRDSPADIARRQDMVDAQLARRDITDPAVLRAMREVPRHWFVPPELQASAYGDFPLPIGNDQTISQPYIVALMTQLAEPRPTARALDIGTGSGYQAAILSQVCQRVDSLEIVPALAQEAQARLARMGFANIHVHCGDGYHGWPERAPYDVIIVAAAPEHVPPPLVERLAPGGRLVIPVGQSGQELLLVEKSSTGVVQQRGVAPVAFVPMTGQAQQVVAPRLK